MTTNKRRTAQQPDDPHEITAQPRPITDEMISGLNVEHGLSVDPDDLGSHFLSEATEQGDFQPILSGQGYELSLASAPPDDPELAGANLEPDASVWEQTVDLALQNVGVEPVAIGAADIETQLEEREQARHSVSHIRELSLFDREGAEDGETTTPEAVAEDGGRHARQTAHVPLGAQVDGAQPSERPSKPGSPAQPTLLRGTRSALKRVASKLRGAAEKLERSASRSKRSR